MRKSLKIAMVAACPFPWSRGTPVRIHRLAEALCKQGHEVHVLTYHLGDTLVPVPFKIHRIPTIRTYNKYSPGPTIQKLVLLDFLLGVKLRQLLRTVSIDIVHAHHYEGLLVSSAIRASNKCPVIYDAHTLLESELPFYSLGLSEWLKRKIGHSLDNILPRLAHHIITVSPEIRDALLHQGRITPERITVIPNGVEVQYFHINKEAPAAVHKTTKHLIFAGNLAPYQGIELLLQAFHEVTTKRQDIRLVIVTDSAFDPYESLANAIGIRDRIDIIHAAFAQVPRYLELADVVLNPRVRCDGLPQKLLNYMAAGKPIVSFAGSAKILENEDTALVVEDYNITAFANAILRLLENPKLAQALGANARDVVESNFTWEIAATRAEGVYEAALKNGSHP